MLKIKTQMSIYLMYIFISPISNEGVISNKDGKIKLFNIKDTIVISHINYKTQKIIFDNKLNENTIYLEPLKNKLDDITLYDKNIL